MLTEQTIIDKIEILEDCQIQVRQARRIFDDGKKIAETYHRHVLAPGDDISKEDPRVILVAKVFHTPEVVAQFRANRRSEVKG
jgi:hypothetical protein